MLSLYPILSKYQTCLKLFWEPGVLKGAICNFSTNVGLKMVMGLDASSHTNKHIHLLCIHSTGVIHTIVETIPFGVQDSPHNHFTFLAALEGLAVQNLTRIVKSCLWNFFPQWRQLTWCCAALLCFCLAWFTKPALLCSTKQHPGSLHFKPDYVHSSCLAVSVLGLHSPLLAHSDAFISSFTCTADGRPIYVLSHNPGPPCAYLFLADAFMGHPPLHHSVSFGHLLSIFLQRACQLASTLDYECHSFLNGLTISSFFTPSIKPLPLKVCSTSAPTLTHPRWHAHTA